jgi:hypothetical protein
MHNGNRKARGDNKFIGASRRRDRSPRPDLSSRLLRIINEAADDFDQTGVCPTHAIVLDPQDKGVVLLPDCLPDENTKDVFACVIARTAAGLDAVAVIFLAEIWMPGENWDGVTAPSQCADRREALFVSAETFNTTAAFLWPILRDTGGVRLGERQSLGSEYEGGRFADLLVRSGEGPD